mgnify:CR=1 FL=1
MKISIIVPIYNVEKYIRKCIESIINQTYRNIEIILVDDGSPDNCGKICDEYAKKDSRVKVIHKKNGGLSDARNKGTEVATGEYIMYVDSDDYIELSACEELYNIINAGNVDIVCYNFKKVDELGNIIDNKKIYSQGNSKKEIEMSFKDAMIDNLYRKHIRYEAGSKIYANKIAKKISFPTNMLAEDFATFYKFLAEARKIIFYDRCLYNYVQRNGSIMAEKKEKLYLDMFITEKNIYIVMKSICKNYEDKRILENRHFNNLLKIYAKIYYSKDEENLLVKREVEKYIDNISFRFLNMKGKFMYFLYKTNKNILVLGIKKIYKRI